MDTIYDVIIIGAGPAGLTAGLYTTRAKLRTLIIEKETIGGELMNRDLIENWPGYPDGILGQELGSNMVSHYSQKIIKQLIHKYPDYVHQKTIFHHTKLSTSLANEFLLHTRIQSKRSR